MRLHEPNDYQAMKRKVKLKDRQMMRSIDVDQEVIRCIQRKIENGELVPAKRVEIMLKRTARSAQKPYQQHLRKCSREFRLFQQKHGL